MIMAHISVSNHFKRQENALSDKDSGSLGSHVLSTGCMCAGKKTRKNI